MSSVMVMVLIIVSLFIPGVRPSQDLWKLDCPPTVGIVAQTTVISCVFRGITDIKIVAVVLVKATQDKPVLEIKPNKNEKSGDPRFSLENPGRDPSLQISDTMFSDEGEYMYRVLTNRGEKSVRLNISVTAKYKNIFSSTWPRKVTDGGRVDLYCNATDGYPAGFIHWFDRQETNWTINSDLKKTTNDTNGVKSVALSSKLTFMTVNSELEPFRCIVLNSKYVQEGESTLMITAKHDSDEESSTSNTKNIIAGVMVIGSLIVGLLCALLFSRKRKVQRYYESGKTEDYPETDKFRPDI